MANSKTSESYRFDGIETLEPRLMLSGTAYLVDSLADVVAVDGVVTLREAIMAANTNAVFFDAPAGSAEAADIISFHQVALSNEAGVAFGEPLTITLSGKQLEITDDLIVQGLGADVLSVDARKWSRVAYIEGEATEVVLAGLTLTRGRMVGNGGGIYIDSGSLVLMDSTVSGNYIASNDRVFGGGHLQRHGLACADELDGVGQHGGRFLPVLRYRRGHLQQRRRSNVDGLDGV